MVGFVELLELRGRLYDFRLGRRCEDVEKDGMDECGFEGTCRFIVTI